MRASNRCLPEERGFTLIELLITLVIVSVGMLGMAKLQAAAIAESQVSRVRSLMTFQAESLSGIMQANRSYWGATTGTAPHIKVGAGGLTDTAATMKATGTAAKCAAVGTSCDIYEIAFYDATLWANSFNAQFPNGTAEVTCTVTANLPTTCDIALNWKEHYVAVNRSTAAGKSSDSTINMILHVQP
jgi:type IV pilus assembly protein PilV